MTSETELIIIEEVTFVPYNGLTKQTAWQQFIRKVKYHVVRAYKSIFK